MSRTQRAIVYKVETQLLEVKFSDLNPRWVMGYTFATARYGANDDYTWRVFGEPPALGAIVEVLVAPASSTGPSPSPSETTAARPWWMHESG